MGKWLKKMGKLAKQAGQAAITHVAEEVDVTSIAGDLGPTVAKMQQVGSQCQASARETVEICESTNEHRQQVIDMASEIQSTLTNFNGQDASVLETIKSLTNESRLKEAADLARGLDDAALKCVEQSTAMIDELEAGMESLPPLVQKALDFATDDDDDDDEDETPPEEIRGLDEDIRDVETCVQNLTEMNLTTALPVGLRAFEQLSYKATKSRDLFDRIQGFAQTVQDLTNFGTISVQEVRSKARDMLECLRLTDLIRAIAEATGKLVKMLVRLFEAAASKISALWAALAYAKDCMADCLTHVNETKSICLDAVDQSNSLLTTSRSVQGKLETAGEMNAASIAAVKELVESGEIGKAIDLAQSMDDRVVSCSEKVTAMIDRVKQGFDNMPTVLTDGIDIETAGKTEDEPDIPDVQPDIEELDTCQKALEDANIVSACRAGYDGFAGVSGKTEVCQQLLTLVESFCGNSSRTIDSFMGAWDLESAATKIGEMCSLVNLGKLVQALAKQLKSLIIAIVRLLRTALSKFSKEGLGDLTSGAKEAMEDVKDKLEDKVDEVKDKFKNSFKKFW